MKKIKPNNTSATELSAEELQIAHEIQTRESDTNRTRTLNCWENGQIIDQAYGDKKEYGSDRIGMIADHNQLLNSFLDLL